MGISISSIVLFSAIVLTGLSAGFFYAWEFTVIPGTKRVSDHTYIETMQSVNRAIINPAFMLIFFGPLVLQLLSTLQLKGTHAIWYLVAAIVLYCGALLVSMVGNVPMNDALDVVHLKSLSPELIISQRSHYEPKWNRLHFIRTAFAVFSFATLLLTAFISHPSKDLL